MGGLAEFFFNIVPGTFILLAISVLFPDTFKTFTDLSPDSETFKLAIFAVMSLFIGFFLQILTKVLKENCVYKNIWEKLGKDNNLYEDVKNLLSKQKLVTDKNKDGFKEEDQREQVFFTMDNYLSIEGGGRLLPHFASRSAYWSNLGWTFAVITFLIILSCFLESTNLDKRILLAGLVISISLSFLSWVTFIAHQKQHYEIVLRTFASKIAIDKNNIWKNKKMLKSDQPG